MRERLAQSLHNAVWLTLGMERQDYRVQRPWSVTVGQQSQSAVALDVGTRIVDVFNRPEFARQLLILGEPGAGKTTMMLELAEDLLKRAIADKVEPIPVLLSLSSWKNPQQSIFEWLVGELKSKYGIRQDLAQQWLKKNQLLPLLDGLDEVTPQHQKACAVALNAWLTKELTQRPCGVMICCRREEFEQVVRQPLSLYGAIYLQALTVEQIEDYFAQFGLQDVWQTVQQDEVLQKLLTTPLFLSMFGLVQTQSKFSLSDWRSRITSDHKIEYLLDTYWDAAIERELIIDPVERQQGICSKTYGKKPLPRRKAVRRSLIFAAKMLDRESSTELLIEKMQPAALITQRQKWAYRLIYGLIVGLIVGLIFGLVVGLVVGLVIGLVVGLDTIEPVEKISISMSRFARREIWRSLRKGLVGELDTIEPVEKISISMSRFARREIWRSLRKGLIVGLIVGLKADIQTRIEPNQGIKNSVKNMVIVSVIALVTALPFKSFLEHLLASVVAPNVVTSIVQASLTCLIWFSFLESGGKALSQHLALRLVLAWNHYAPWRYDLLLNYCTERLLLQRVGGRYRFMHKLLQDHFAKMDLERQNAGV